MTMSSSSVTDSNATTITTVTTTTTTTTTTGTGGEQQQQISTGDNNNIIFRRNAKGCKSEEFCAWPDEQFEEMDSTIAVHQLIQQKIRNDPFDVNQILTPPAGQDIGVWKYEHMRQFCMELNGLTVRLQEECTPETCSQMTATEQWIFLCAAHKAPKECPAIDYTRHTLDGAALLLNSNKYFPSRITIKDSSVAKLGSVCRRVYRIFSHAYYHHKAIYDQFETAHALCKRFSVFALKYELMSAENLIVPVPGVDLNAIECAAKESGGGGGGGQSKPSTTTTTTASSVVPPPVAGTVGTAATITTASSITTTTTAASPVTTATAIASSKDGQPTQDSTPPTTIASLVSTSSSSSSLANTTMIAGGSSTASDTSEA